MTTQGPALPSHSAGSFAERLRCPVCFTINLVSHLNKKMPTSAITNPDYRCALCGTGLDAGGAASEQAA